MNKETNRRRERTKKQTEEKKELSEWKKKLHSVLKLLWGNRVGILQRPKIAKHEKKLLC